MKNNIVDILGNAEILKLYKVAFLCSRQIPSSVVLKCYDWATEQRDKGNCVISGFHSLIEKEVFYYLLKGKQPIIIVMARGLKDTLEQELVKPVEQGRLLIVSSFSKQVKKITTETAQVRNQLMLDLADEVVLGYKSSGGNIDKIISNIKTKPLKYII